MAKNFKRVISTFMVTCALVGTLPLQALAVENTETKTETTHNGALTTTVTTTTTTTTDENGNTNLTVQIKDTSTSGKDENGLDYSYQETVKNTTDYSEPGKVAHSEVVDGSEKSAESSFTGDVTVSVSTNTGDKNTVVSGDPAGTSSTVDTEDGHITTTVEKQQSVTVTTNDVTFSEVVDSENTEMEYVKNETTPNGTNDLIYSGDAAGEMYRPGYTGDVVVPEIADGYEYVYVGSGNTSKLVPAIVFTSPMTDEQKLAQYGDNAYIKKNSITYYYVGCLTEEDRSTIAKDENGNYVTDAEGYILDVNGNRILKEELTTKDPSGNTYYLHRFDATGKGHKVEGWYENGEWVSELNGSNQYTAVWAGPQQFILMDANGNLITTYCADSATPTQDVYGYNVENLEDATYYSEEEAKQIRSIVRNGYWGTVGTEIDENGNTVPKMGSLEAVKQMLLDSGEFTEDEVASLTDGAALTATQMAIWSCSNKMSGIKFVNAHYSNWGTGNVSKDKEDEVKLMFRLYDYLIALEPTEVENTTADTIINQDNFLKDMSITVIEKDESHKNNQDSDHTNDAYVTDITFALMVTPSTENGDDLVVTVMGTDGKPIAIGRIAGEAKDGEIVLTPDADGNYAFNNIVITEGEQSFTLNLQGIQNLKEGVYLYSSEVRTDEDGNGVSSQTMVGVAGGQHGVNVSMDIKFDVSVEDEVIVTERVWHSERETVMEIPPEEEEVPPTRYRVTIEGDGTEEIPEEPVPLAAAPKTGDNSAMWLILVLVTAMGLVTINVISKKRKTV